MRKPIKIPITSEEFEDILEDARSDKRIWEDRFEVLDMLMMEHEIFKINQYNRLEKYVKKWSQYQMIEAVWKKLLAEICRDKLEKEEDIQYFKKLFKTHCVNNLEKLPEADIDHARNAPMDYIMERMTEHRIKRKMSNCPFCGWKSIKKFACKDNLFHCFKCWVKWDSIWFVMLYTKCNFPQAVQTINSL